MVVSHAGQGLQLNESLQRASEALLQVVTKRTAVKFGYNSCPDWLAEGEQTYAG